MGEWIGASIRFGGTIGADLVPELVDLIKAHGLSVDFEGDDPMHTNLHETFGDWQINYGCLDALEAFAVRHGLDYEHWFDRGPDGPLRPCAMSAVSEWNSPMAAAARAYPNVSSRSLATMARWPASRSSRSHCRRSR